MARDCLEIGLLRLAAVFLLAALSVSTAAGQGQLQDARNSVRTPRPPSSTPKFKFADNDDDHCHDCDDDNELETELFFLGVHLTGMAVTSPFWAPHTSIDEGFETEFLFSRFPYEQGPGYMQIAPYLKSPRRWSARLRTDYADNFDVMERIGGHLLLSTSSRWGLDTQMDYLREEFPNGTHDELWIGDCNVVFRFAQSDNMQWRTGIGMNWLDDPIQTDYGFNFTYGMDYFPGRPWVISSTLDWGTLGHTSLFRFRSTAGVIVRRFETYAGYEYLDIGQTQTSSLIAGVRVWF